MSTDSRAEILSISQIPSACVQAVALQCLSRRARGEARMSGKTLGQQEKALVIVGFRVILLKLPKADNLAAVGMTSATTGTSAMERARLVATFQMVRK